MPPQGTERTARPSTDEEQLKSYGCNTERIRYEHAGRQIRLPGDTTRPAPRPQQPGQRRNPVKGTRGPTGVNSNPELQPDTALRRINAQPDTPGPREEVYCTKIGSTRPGEMYIIGAHMDGHGSGRRQRRRLRKPRS